MDKYDRGCDRAKVNVNIVSVNASGKFETLYKQNFSIVASISFDKNCLGRDKREKEVADRYVNDHDLMTLVAEITTDVLYPLPFGFSNRDVSPCFTYERGDSMEGLTFRKSNPNDIELMTQARVAYCLRDEPVIDASRYESLYEDVRKWTVRHVSEGTFISYFGYLWDERACCAGLLLNELPPLYKRSNRKQGYVLSFFTYPQFRRRGLGTELMRYISEDAKEMGIGKLVLLATDEGIPLYRKSGFSEPVMLYMEKKI